MHKPTLYGISLKKSVYEITRNNFTGIKSKEIFSKNYFVQKLCFLMFAIFEVNEVPLRRG